MNLTDNEIMKLEDAIKILEVNVICSPKATDFKEAVAVVTDTINHQKAEIERLNIRNKALTAITKNYDWKFAEAKSEAIKEFADRLKGVFGFDEMTGAVIKCHIDNLVKEMVGD